MLRASYLKIRSVRENKLGSRKKLKRKRDATNKKGSSKRKLASKKNGRIGRLKLAGSKLRRCLEEWLSLTK